MRVAKEGVTDVTSDVERALARANYEARKVSISALEEQISELKEALDHQNAIRLEALNTGRQLQAQIDALNDQITELKMG